MQFTAERKAICLGVSRTILRIQASSARISRAARAIFASCSPTQSNLSRSRPSDFANSNEQRAHLARNASDSCKLQPNAKESVSASAERFSELKRAALASRAPRERFLQVAPRRKGNCLGVSRAISRTQASSARISRAARANLQVTPQRKGSCLGVGRAMLRSQGSGALSSRAARTFLPGEEKPEAICLGVSRAAARQVPAPPSWAQPRASRAPRPRIVALGRRCAGEAPKLRRPRQNIQLERRPPGSDLARGSRVRDLKPGPGDPPPPRWLRHPRAPRRACARARLRRRRAPSGLSSSAREASAGSRAKVSARAGPPARNPG